MSSTITILDLTSEESTSLDTKTVIDRIQQTLYAANGAALFLSIQYKTSEEETCIWSIDVIDQQDIHDAVIFIRSEEHTSELQSRENLVCRLLLEKKKK